MMVGARHGQVLRPRETSCRLPDLRRFLSLTVEGYKRRWLAYNQSRKGSARAWTSDDTTRFILLRRIPGRMDTEREGRGGSMCSGLSHSSVSGTVRRCRG